VLISVHEERAANGSNDAESAGMGSDDGHDGPASETQLSGAARPQGTSTPSSALGARAAAVPHARVCGAESATAFAEGGKLQVTPHPPLPPVLTGHVSSLLPY
jgi:hypothetical protein